MAAVPGTPIAASSPIDPASCWRTPFDLKERIRCGPLGGAIDLDPCTTDANPVGARVFYTPETDGLAQSWQMHYPTGLIIRTIYVNPPFIAAATWARKTVCEARIGPAIVFLGPAAVGTRWFHEILEAADDALLLSKRIRYEGVCVHAIGRTADGKKICCNLDETADVHVTGSMLPGAHEMKIGSPTRGTALFAFNCSLRTLDDLGTRVSVRK